jgi:hypothetical protein
MRNLLDSSGQEIQPGDRVSFRGVEFTVKGAGPQKGRFDTFVVEFEEPVEHTTEVPDEVSIDFISREGQGRSGEPTPETAVRDLLQAAQDAEREKIAEWLDRKYETQLAEQLRAGAHLEG